VPIAIGGYSHSSEFSGTARLWTDDEEIAKETVRAAAIGASQFGDVLSVSEAGSSLSIRKGHCVLDACEEVATPNC